MDPRDELIGESEPETLDIHRMQSGDAGDSRTAPATSTGPKGGQFAVGGGRVGAKGRTKPGRRPAVRPKPSAPAKPAGPLSFDGKRGTGYGIKGGDARVRTLQAALNRLGVLDSSSQSLALDGKYGPRTTSAVKKAQKRLGLEPDGKVTPELLKQLSEMKTLPPTRRNPRAKRSRDEVLELIEGALMNREIQRTPLLFDRSFPLDDIQISRSGDGRTVEAYAAMFDMPYEVRDQHGHYMETIERAAFNRTLSGGAGKNAMCLYNHGMTVHGTADALSSVPLGTPLEIKADGRGLLTVTRYNRSALADSVLEAIRNGDIKSQSFRGRIVRSSPDRMPRRRAGYPLPTVTRHELGLTDYGPTPIPVNAGAEIMAVRSLTELIDDFAQLDEEARLELLRALDLDPPTPEEDPDDEEDLDSEDDTATPEESGPGAEDPPLTRHSGRQTDITRRIRVEMLLRGMS